MANLGRQESAYKLIAAKEKAVKESAAKESAVNEKAMKESAVKEKAVKESAVKEKAVKEKAVRKRAVKESAAKEKVLKKKSSRKNFFGDKAPYGRRLKKKWKDILGGVGIIIILAFFFYRSVWSVPFLLPVYVLYQRENAKDHEQKRQKEISVQFKDAILAVSANQKAGYSVENSFKQSYEDMVLLYGKGSIICQELYTIISGLGNNMVLENMMYDFGNRSGVEEIIEFAQVFAAAKRNGGNLTEVIERSASVIEEKVETEKEIQILISAKRLEQKIMNVVPFGILLYISITSKGFFDVLYHNPAGIMIMTACLAVYIAAVVFSRKIVNIEV